MANLFLNLPAPAANSAGAAVDVSTLGATKTVVVKGNGSAYEPFVIIEASNDPAHLVWTPVMQFNKPGERTFNVACAFLRARVTNYVQGGAPTVDVGSTDAGTQSATLVATAGNGNGVGVDVSALGDYTTVQVSGTYKGAVNIQVSNDGGTSWAPADGLSFVDKGVATMASTLIVADYLRVTRSGIVDREPNPGTPVIYVCGSELAGSAGSTLSGAGTADRIAKWTDTATLGNSSVTDDGVTVTSSVPVATPDLIATPAISPVALAAGVTNDYNPTGFATATTVRLTPNAAGSSITSFVATTDGDVKFIENIGTAGNLTLVNQASTGTAANKIITAGGADLVIPPGGAAIMIRDATTARWRVIAQSADVALGTAITSNVAVPGNTATTILSLPIPAGVLRVGTTFRIEAYVLQTGANATAPDFLSRIGPTTGTGNFAALLTGVSAGNGVFFKIEATITVRTIGAAGTVIGGMMQACPITTTPLSNIGTAVAVDTTIANLLELSMNTNNAANSYSVRVATIFRVNN